MGRRLESEKLSGFAYRLNAAQENAIIATAFNPHRFFKALFEEEMHDFATEPDGDTVYNDIEVFISRRGRYFGALKGGHNGENHNHNDVGNFVVYKDGAPVIIDVGTLEYTKKTFSSERYTIWALQSSFHNLPEIGGMMEHEWKDYHSDRFEKLGDGKAFVGFAGAYPEEIRPEICERTIEISEAGVAVSDRVKSGYDIVFNFMLCKEPTVDGDTVSLGNATLVFEGAKKIVCEKVDLSGSPLLMNVWGEDHLYRLRVTPEGEDLMLRIS